MKHGARAPPKPASSTQRVDSVYDLINQAGALAGAGILRAADKRRSSRGQRNKMG